MQHSSVTGGVGATTSTRNLWAWVAPNVHIYNATRNAVNTGTGWVVERHLQDDDCVVLNRQPALHMACMTGHRVKVLDHSTFRLNPSVGTVPDAGGGGGGGGGGGEATLHAPQSVLARGEVMQLMAAPRVVVSSQAGRSVMGIVQDALLGCQKMTKRGVFVEKDMFFNLVILIDEVL